MGFWDVAAKVGSVAYDILLVFVKTGAKKFSNMTDEESKRMLKQRGISNPSKEEIEAFKVECHANGAKMQNDYLSLQALRNKKT